VFVVPGGFEHRGDGGQLTLVDSVCPICRSRDHAVLLARGEDFEYRTSEDTFEAYHCGRCDVRFIHPRPSIDDLDVIYPADYHAYEFTPEGYGLSYTLRRRIERRRLLRWCSGLPAGATIVDVGAGDGFHLSILKDFGDPTWRLVAVEPDQRAAAAIRERGLEVHVGVLDDGVIEPESVDFVILIMVIEHVDDPLRLLRQAYQILRPGGSVGIVTDNIRSLDARFGRGRHWGGYHFPRHFNLFSRGSLSTVASAAGFEVAEMKTMVSPVNWTYTVHNYLVDRAAPDWLVNWFTLRSPLAMAVFTAIDSLAVGLGAGALLRAKLRRPGP
jgi:SAM-dependent methyltransferase